MLTPPMIPEHAPKRSMSNRRQAISDWLTGRESTIEGSRVALDPAGAVVPTPCACCGATASMSRCERHRHGTQTLIVPYCVSCHAHASAVDTRVLALSLAAVLLGISTAVAVPSFWEWVPAPVYLLSVAIAAGLPAAVGRVVRTGPGAKPHAPGRAVWWAGDGVLTCTNAVWASEFAHANHAPIETASVRERLWSPWMLSATVVGVVAAPFWLSYQRASMRVLNLTDSRLVLSADGRRLTAVEPSSAESSAAGVDVRIPAGPRTLELRTPEGRLVRRTNVFIQAGRRHLYAPASPTYCFWLETMNYQSSSPTQPEVEPLTGEDRFWVLPSELDTWLAPNPPAASLGVRSTGGVLVALRQGLCTDAPWATALPSMGPMPE